MIHKRFFNPAVFCFVFAVLAVFLFSGYAQADATEKAIDQVRIDYNKAFSAGDIAKTMRLVDADAVWMPPGQKAVVGKKNVEALLKASLASVRSHLDLNPGRIQVAGPWAFLSGKYTRVDTVEAGGKKTAFAGSYLFVLKKQTDGGWKIAQDIWN